MPLDHYRSVNAPLESFFAALKTERVHEAQFRTRAEARAAVFEYIEVFYNRQRLHSALGYRTPAEPVRPATWVAQRCRVMSNRASARSRVRA